MENEVRTTKADRTKEHDRQINLLVALLVKYPEISSVHVAAAKNALELSFLLRGAVEPALIDALEYRLQASLDALSKLDGRGPRNPVVTYRVHNSLTRLVISRSLADLAAEEFALILAAVQECCGDLLIVDEGQSDLPVDLLEEDGTIDATLEALRAKGAGQKLIGIRDGGRVLVFNDAKL